MMRTILINQNQISAERVSAIPPGDVDVGVSYWWRTSSRGRNTVHAIFLTSIVWLPSGLLLTLGLWIGDVAAAFYKWRTAVLAWLVCGGAAFLLTLAREFWRAVGASYKRTQEIDHIERNQLALRSKGDESEEMVAKVLEEVASQLDPLYWCGRGLIFRYPESRPDQVSMFEIDNLLITNFGVFLIEVKNWKSRVEIAGDNWTVINGAGRDQKQSPLKQSQPKLRVLEAIAREVLGECPAMKVHSLAVFTHREGEFPLTAPAEVLYLKEVRYFLRTAYLLAQKAGLPSRESVQRFRNRLERIQDKRPEAKHEFMLELAKKKGDSSGYLEQELRKQHLRSLHGLHIRPYCASPLMYVVLVAYLAFGAWKFQPTTRGGEVERSNAGVLPPIEASARKPDKRAASSTKTSPKEK